MLFTESEKRDTRQLETALSTQILGIIHKNWFSVFAENQELSTWYDNVMDVHVLLVAELRKWS